VSHQHIVQAFNTAAFGLDDLPEPEPDADEHLRRHLAGETPLAPYDGSKRLRPWSKAWDASHVHRITCVSCGIVGWSGDRHHHVENDGCFPCSCAPPGALPDFHIRCPPGCSGRRD
jgi:hypothetical protein